MATQPFQSEEELVAWLASQSNAIGDDAAFLSPLGDTAVTVDSQREGVHFRPGTPAQVVARRLLAVNLSDLAAVGAVPHHALCTLAAPRNFDRRLFFQALLDACEAQGVQLVGGDLSSSETVECTLTAVGTRQSHGQFLRRSSARVGDELWGVGSFGESALGRALIEAGANATSSGVSLPKWIPRDSRPYARRCVRRHLVPEPQLAAGRWLARRRSPIAAIDVSDGLVKDARRLAVSSQVHIEIDLSAVHSTIDADRFTALADHLQLDPTTLQLAGGEDYALLWCAPAGLATAINLNLGPLNAVSIGSAVSSPRGSHGDTVCLFDSTGRLPAQRLKAADYAGWDHLGSIQR